MEKEQKNITNEVLDQEIKAGKDTMHILEEERKPIYTVYKWSAPERVFENKERSWYIAVAAIAMTIIVVSALTGNWLLIITVVCLILLLYSLNSIPPKNVTHEITNKGINVFQDLIAWRNITTFWVTQRGEHTLIHFEVISKKDNQPYKLILLQGDGDIKKIVAYIVQFVDYLGVNETGFSLLSRISEGRHQPITTFIDNPDIITKDPRDAAAVLNKMRINKATESK